MTDEKPRKTLSITRKPASTTAQAGNNDNAPTTIKRTGKRIITREQLPNVQKPGTPKKPPKKPNKPTQGKRPRQPPKPKKTPPSELRARELNDSLNAFAVWRNHQPLAWGIEKQMFCYIAEECIQARGAAPATCTHTSMGISASGCGGRDALRTGWARSGDNHARGTSILCP